MLPNDGPGNTLSASYFSVYGNFKEQRFAEMAVNEVAEKTDNNTQYFFLFKLS